MYIMLCCESFVIQVLLKIRDQIGNVVNQRRMPIVRSENVQKKLVVLVSCSVSYILRFIMLL